MDDETRPGFYRDADGVWQPDRRRAPDRRRRAVFYGHHDRRAYFRRKTDLAILDREAKLEINDALADLAEERE